MRILCCFCLIGLGLEVSPVEAQQVLRTVPAPRLTPANPFGGPAVVVQDGIDLPPNAVIIGPDGQPVQSAPGAGAAPPTGEFDAEAMRLQKLLALNFDRSPAAVLAAWAKELLPPDPETPSEEVKSAEASPSTDQAVALDPAALAAAEEAKKKAAEVAEKTKAIDAEIENFARHVTLGRWPEVATYLATLPKDHPKQVYQKLLQSFLAAPATAVANNEVPATVMPRHSLRPADIIALADVSPEKPSESDISQLATLLLNSKQQGFVADEVVKQLQTGTKWFGGSDSEKREFAALFLLAAEQPDAALEFLPSWPSDETISVLGLKLLARYFETKYAQDNKPAILTQSWLVHQRLLAAPDLKPADRTTVLRRTVELSTMVEKELGQAWLDESFTTNLERGVRVLSELGVAASSELPMTIQDSERRKTLLSLQNKAAEALVKTAGETAGQWRDTLTILAVHWLNEAQVAETYASSSGQNSMMQFDRYGNFFYMDGSDPRFGGQNFQGVAPISVLDLLELQPSPAWTALIHAELQPKLAAMLAKLYLKVKEEAKAFPQIEKLAPSQPVLARELVHDFLRAWTTNHDPNSEQRMFNPYMYIYGYNQQASGIPLSRSRQQRNLAELSAWVTRIRALPIEPIEEDLLAQAFTTCHSSAEVFQVESFVAVFGQIDSLKPETVASLATTMRGNLASVWRQVRVQEAYKTKRKEREIQAEVLRGYQVALSIVENARQKHKDDWRLQLAEATLMFDENAYRQTVQPTSEFADRRQTTFAQFQHAADLYRAAVPTMNARQHSTDVYDYWFYAALGATDLGQISHENQPVPGQFPLILQAIQSLPGKTADEHLGRFANQLFTRMGTVQPQAKYRFLKAGFEIVGDHPRALEAKKSFEYYNDVTSEIKLVAEIDGSDVIGHSKPFGVIFKLLHTTDMERESGGFEKYVQNQTQSPYSFNYGRPNEDYRNKFQESTTKALSENFEVISMTFEEPKSMKSRPADREGWRETAYAYALLKARGPQIDRLPPIQLNLDFVDSSGFVVLPIESAAVVVDASAKDSPPRPFADLELLQTVDERQAAEGKLILEVQGKAKGLVPELKEILDLNFPDLEVARMDDQQVAPKGFDPESNEILITSDRSWILELKAKPGHSLQTFSFLQPKGEGVSVRRQQYRDADLVEASETIQLGTVYQRVDWTQRIMYGVLGLGILTVGVVGAVMVSRRKPVVKRAQFHLPAEINAFTVLGLLKEILAEGTLSDKERSEINQTIGEIQTSFFGRGTNSRMDLEKVARKWVG
ncbi:MAG: hypothetical protein JNL67_20375 [Planctomycetaceae bacterium]|nr:hypothetical protein [Planctomycetaceae bacterium]